MLHDTEPTTLTENSFYLGFIYLFGSLVGSLAGNWTQAAAVRVLKPGCYATGEPSFVLGFRQQLYLSGTFPRFGVQHGNIHCWLYSLLRSSKSKPAEGRTSQVMLLKPLFWETFGSSEITRSLPEWVQECLYTHCPSQGFDRPCGNEALSLLT